MVKIFKENKVLLMFGLNKIGENLALICRINFKYLSCILDIHDKTITDFPRLNQPTVDFNMESFLKKF